MKHLPNIVFVLLASAALAQDSLKTTTLQDVVVTGQYEAQSLRKSVYQVRTIKSDVIRLRAATNVQAVLNTELGVRFTNDPVLGTADISLMGMSGQNVKILLDGVPLLDRGATRESLNQIDINTVERIEIVEGPMSVVYGTDALAGVINIITKKGGNKHGVSVNARVLEETANTEYDPFSEQGTHYESVNLNWEGKTWNAFGGATRNNFGGWRGDSEGRTKRWLPKNQWLGNGGVGFTKRNFDIWYRLNYLNETINSAGEPNANTNIAIDKDYITNRFTHQAQAEWMMNDRWSFTGMLSHQDYSRKTRTTTFNTVTGDRRLLPEPGTQDEAKFNTNILRGIFLCKVSSKVSLQPGVDLNLTEGLGDRIDGTRAINDYALFVSSEISPKQSVSIRPGLRFIYNSVYSAPPVIPSLNAKFTLNKALDLRLAYGYGFRSPALRELYFSFFDASHSIKGNTDLKAEYSNSFSASLAWVPPVVGGIHFTSTLGGFYNAFENLITIGIDAENPSVNTYINIYKYRTAGLTLSNAMAYKSIKAGLGFSYIGIYNQLAEEDSSLPSLLYVPEVNGTLSYSFRTGTDVSFFYKFTGKRSNYETRVVDGAQTIVLAKQDSFHWLDVTVNQKLNIYISLNAGVKNVTDVTSIQNTSQGDGGAHSTGGAVPMSYGRSYFAGVNFTIR